MRHSLRERQPDRCVYGLRENYCNYLYLAVGQVRALYVPVHETEGASRK